MTMEPLTRSIIGAMKSLTRAPIGSGNLVYVRKLIAEIIRELLVIDGMIRSDDGPLVKYDSGLGTEEKPAPLHQAYKFLRIPKWVMIACHNDLLQAFRVVTGRPQSDLMYQLETPAPSKRKFWRSVYLVEVLSEEDLEHTDLDQLILRTDCGDDTTPDGVSVGRVMHEEINPAACVSLLEDQGLSGALFGLSEHGDDML